MALNPRQLACYVHRADVWRITRPVAGGGTPGDDVYVRVYQEQRVHFGWTDNISDASDIAGIKRPSVFTTDHMTADMALTIKADDLIVNVTPGDPLFGSANKAQGDPKIVRGGGNRRVNSQQIQIFSEPHPPAEVAAA